MHSLVALFVPPWFSFTCERSEVRPVSSFVVEMVELTKYAAPSPLRSPCERSFFHADLLPRQSPRRAGERWRPQRTKATLITGASSKGGNRTGSKKDPRLSSPVYPLRIPCCRFLSLLCDLLLLASRCAAASFLDCSRSASIVGVQVGIGIRSSPCPDSNPRVVRRLKPLRAPRRATTRPSRNRRPRRRPRESQSRLQKGSPRQPRTVVQGLLRSRCRRTSSRWPPRRLQRELQRLLHKLLRRMRPRLAIRPLRIVHRTSSTRILEPCQARRPHKLQMLQALVYPSSRLVPPSRALPKSQ